MGITGVGVGATVWLTSLRRVLRMPWRGLFMCPFAVAGLGLRYLRINFSDKLGHPFRKPFLTALSSFEIFGLPNDWWANFTPFARVRTECVKSARLTPGWMLMSLWARSISGADRGRAVLVASRGSVHKPVVSSLKPRKMTLPSYITSHFSLSNVTVHPASHNGRMPISDAIARCGTMCPVNTFGKPGIVMSQT